MTRLSRRGLAFVLLVLLAALLPFKLSGQRQSDPLTADQEEQVREVADQPNERVKLFLKFAQERIDSIHQLTVHPVGQHPGVQIHRSIAELTQLLDELDDNLDVYDESHQDIRKSLRVTIDQVNKWPETLNQLPPSPDYDFPRKSALEAVASTIDSARTLLSSQQEYFGKHKTPKN